VAGIMAARGGAGAGWLLGRLDPELFRTHPKVFVGYSDLTYLHLFLDHIGIASVHGPMVARELADGGYDRASLLHALTGAGAPFRDDELEPVRPGQARGTLRGGCLSILAAVEGTPWALPRDPEGTILFLEDVDEPPYRLDRMILQLRDAGALAGVRGIVFGDMKGCSPPLAASFSFQDVIREALAGLDVPIALGLSSGHTSSPHVSLPFGVSVRLEVGESAVFEVLDSAVA
jgi:muramoyltetrapeptide carboxypeptidase